MVFVVVNFGDRLRYCLIRLPIILHFDYGDLYLASYCNESCLFGFSHNLSLSNSTEPRYHCYVCESCRLSFYFWENKKKISNEFLLFPGFFFLSVFLAFFPCLNKSIMLLRKPCCYYYVCRCCCCCCRCSGVSFSFVLCIVLIFYVFFLNEICIRNWNLKQFCWRLSSPW